MKKILITGANSYIGTSLMSWLSQYPEKYEVTELDLRDESWTQKDFSQFDVVYHVAGIAHIKQTEKNKELYYKVNRDLTIEVAKKAKENKIKQFIFLSSMSVYGIEQGVINKDTIPNPQSHYGKSKFEAEQQLLAFENKEFKIAILRPPMVYGKGCKGNFVKLDKLTDIISVFPRVNNKRSMIYIGNLDEFVKIIIDNAMSGVFCPQNKEYVCTSEMINILGTYKNKKICLVPGFEKLIIILSYNFNIFGKIFGSLTYSHELSKINYTYQVFDFKDSIKRSI